MSVEFKQPGNDRSIDLQLGHTPTLDVAVLASDVWGYVEQFVLQTGGHNATQARTFWRQAERFAASLMSERPEASPLHLYYMMLNAVKTLLVLKKGAGTVAATKSHGARFEPATDRELKSGKRSKQTIPGALVADGKGTLGLLSSVMGDTTAPNTSYLLEDLLSNVVAVQRAYCTLRPRHQDRFLSVEKHVRLVGADDEYRFEAVLSPDWKLTHHKKAIPNTFDVTTPLAQGPMHLSFKEFLTQREVLDPVRFQSYHAKVRRHFDIIVGQERPKYYLRRADLPQVELSQITINFSIALSLSSLARYYPQHLQVVFDRPDGWLLKEYLRLTPHQFLALIAGEITGRIIQRPYSDLR